MVHFILLFYTLNESLLTSLKYRAALAALQSYDLLFDMRSIRPLAFHALTALSSTIRGHLTNSVGFIPVYFLNSVLKYGTFR